MFLAIDVGNTNVVAAWHDGGWSAPQRWMTDLQASAAQWREQLRDFIPAVPLPIAAVATQRVVVGVASVVPSVNAPLAAALRALFPCEPVFITATNCGLRFRVPDPSSVGADRLADAVGAAARVGVPALVIDFGTAITFEYVDADRYYHAGPIVPGARIMQQALSDTCALLPPFEFAAITNPLPPDTITGMQAGIFQGIVGATTHILGRLQQQVGAAAPILATGGHAETIIPHLPPGVQHVPLLTLEGIQVCVQSPPPRGK